MAIFKPGKGLPPDTGSAGSLILDFPPFRIVSEGLMVNPPSLWYFC